jgi:thiamine biosynthesis lipoprotein ApbE
MALVTSAQFDTYLNPDGITGPPSDAAQPVVLTLSDGQSVTVADAKTTALSLMEAMRQRKQWMAQLSDDVFVISIGATKLMFCENSLTLQRFVTSFHGVYLHGSTLFSHRNLSQQATLHQALLQPGQLF